MRMGLRFQKELMRDTLNLTSAYLSAPNPLPMCAADMHLRRGARVPRICPTSEPASTPDAGMPTTRQVTTMLPDNFIGAHSLPAGFRQ
jgi:hypothetical protein